MYEFDWQKLSSPLPMDEGREATLQRFFEIMEAQRAVVLRNTPVQDYIDEAFSWVIMLDNRIITIFSHDSRPKHFFNSTTIRKRPFSTVQEALPTGGIVPSGKKKAVERHSTTREESFDFGNDGDENRQRYWPPEESLPDFYTFMKWFFDALYMFQMDILGLIEEHYHLTPGRLTSMHSQAQNELRLLHYPGLKTSVLQDPQKAVRFGEHTDFGTITVLFQRPAGGLHFQSAPSAGGDWIEVMSGPTDAIVTFGDTFERWTNGLVPAGRHRVQAPSEAGDWCQARYSIAYFCKADPEQSIGALQEFRHGDQPDEKTITVAEYNDNQQRIAY
ncbi:hypothetical protein RBB50_012468 [Rhinocladiella similis]